MAQTKPHAFHDISHPPIAIRAVVTVATIQPSKSATHNMVEAAFLSAGQFLDERASRGEQATLFFDYMGARFRASCAPIGEPLDEVDVAEEVD